MSDLLSELRSPVALPKMCQFGKIQQILTAEELSTIETILIDLRDAIEGLRPSNYTFEWLAETLTKHGHTISATTISRHTRRKCACERS
jgi:hypothetical protein